MDNDTVAVYWDFENLHASLYDALNGSGSYGKKQVRGKQQDILVDVQTLYDFATTFPALVREFLFAVLVASLIPTFIIRAIMILYDDNVHYVILVLYTTGVSASTSTIRTKWREVLSEVLSGVLPGVRSTSVTT